MPLTWVKRVFYTSNNSHSESSADMHLPKMLDSSKAKQEHSEAADKFFDEYMQQNLTPIDLKLLHRVYSNKDLAEFKMDDKSLSKDNTINNQTRKLDENPEQPLDLISKSLNLMNISAFNLLDKHEEQKASSPKSAVSMSKFVQETNLDIVEYFNHIDSNIGQEWRQDYISLVNPHRPAS